MPAHLTATGRFELTAIDTIDQAQAAFRQFPQIHVLPCGEWMITFCFTDDAYFAKAACLRSADRGKTWKLGGWSTDAGNFVDLGGGRCAMIDGFYPLHKGGDGFAIQACYSSDGGKTFGPPELSVPLTVPGAHVHSLHEMMQMYFTLPCYPWNRYFKANGYPHIAPGWPETAKKIFFGAMGPTSNTVGLSDGRLISMAYCRGKRADVTAADYWFAYALESADRGKLWRHVGGVPWEPKFAGEEALFGGTGFTEAGLALLDSGELLIVLRSGSHQPMATCRSSDAGRAWSSPEVVKLEPTGEPARGVFPVLKKLSNGWLACVYGRPGIQLMVDETGTGRHWRHEIDLKAEEARRCERGGAPADFYSTENVGLAELAPGEIGITYDLAGWTESRDKEWVRQTIRMARLRVRGS